MKYYEMHEIVYDRLKQENKLSWDKSSTCEEMFKHGTNLSLHKLLSAQKIALDELQVLDLGTGTGTSALYLAQYGARVTGVDISSTAIELAHKNAQSLDLKAYFHVGDVLSFDLGSKFDLVVDSTILHCIVGDEDRKKFYQVVKNHLKSNGLFFVNTMIVNSDMATRFPKEFFLYQDNVLWSLGIQQIQERKTIDGKSYFPHRTILSRSDQIKELAQHGFEIVIEESSDNDFIALLRSST